MEVTRSGYYSWCRRGESARKRSDEKLSREIWRIHRESDETYGSPRVQAELADGGQCVGENRVARLMRAHGVKGIQQKGYRITTDSWHKRPVADNRLNRQFTVEEINRVWAADITQIPTYRGWLYLAVVMDLCSRRIIGWSMSKRCDKNLAIGALEMALTNRRPTEKLLHHSDQGSVYASEKYAEKLTDYGIEASMSKKGDCYDNAPVESFFATLKRERTNRKRYAGPERAKTDIFDYIECWYNPKRRHSTLGQMSPANFEYHLEQNQNKTHS